MAINYLRLACCFTIISLTYGQPTTTPSVSCGDWIPFRDEKCIKVVYEAGLQNKDDANVVCQEFGEELHSKVLPKLVTIKSKEEQQFLQELLFDEFETFDNVWLGLNLVKDGVFRWNDGDELLFTNWAKDEIKQEFADHERNCVEMESGESGQNKPGEWAKANCKKKNAIVCEKDQTSSLDALNNAFLKLKLQVENNKKDSEMKLDNAITKTEGKINDTIIEIEEKIQKAKNASEQTLKDTLSKVYEELNEVKLKIANLQNSNQVPIGFVYVELPGRESPSTLWPEATWKDVSSEYAGLFFRVEGGEAAPFGVLQEDNTRRLAEVNSLYNEPWDDPEIPSDGSWSQHAYTGDNGGGKARGLKFRLTKGEIRPKNKSVKIWQRIK